VKKKNKASNAKIGYLPCFSAYDFRHFPYEKLYDNSSAVAKVQQLLAAFVNSYDPPRQLHRDNGIGKGGITPIRPGDSKEATELIRLLGYPFQIYRIDYGDTKFRVVFGLSTADNRRIAHVLAFDTDHKTFG